jgi:(p)ppGpp synthase/HD superfamily hydrolase
VVESKWKLTADVAEDVARAAHAGQIDKAGRPYIGHVERVVAAVPTDEAKAVAWLHDVIEDTPIGPGQLWDKGIDWGTILSVRTLTKRPDERGNDGYAAYIDRVIASDDRIAIVVKLADIRDHLNNPGCPEGLRPRYERALAKLTALPWVSRLFA